MQNRGWRNKKQHFFIFAKEFLRPRPSDAYGTSNVYYTLDTLLTQNCRPKIFCRGLSILKIWWKTLICSVSYPNSERLGALFGGAKPTKTFNFNHSNLKMLQNLEQLWPITESNYCYMHTTYQIYNKERCVVDDIWSIHLDQFFPVFFG